MSKCDDEFQGMFIEIWRRPINRAVRHNLADTLSRDGSKGFDEKAILAMGEMSGVTKAVEAECRDRLKDKYLKAELDKAALAAQIPNANEI